MAIDISAAQDNFITQLQAISCNLDLIVSWFFGDLHGFPNHAQIYGNTVVVLTCDEWNVHIPKTV